MHSGFFTKMQPNKLAHLPYSLTCHQSVPRHLETRITRIHTESFLNTYENYSEEQLGLGKNKTKEQWLLEMIQKKLDAVKKEELSLATVSVSDEVVGFLVCSPLNKKREAPKSSVMPNRFHFHQHILHDVPHIIVYLIATKPFFNHHNQKLQIGLGTLLIQSLEKWSADACFIRLSTRRINTSAMSFYEAMNFKRNDRNTFDGSSVEHYVGYEKRLNRSMQPMSSSFDRDFPLSNLQSALLSEFVGYDAPLKNP